MKIYCCGCQKEINARLANGMEIYPHRPDISDLPFWRCDICKNYVGCHHKTRNRTQPLGNIPTAEIRNARKHIHAILDPLWKQKKFKRGWLYRSIAERMNIPEYHTGEIKSIDDARKVYQIVKDLRKLG